jgi:hypothetical protein
VPRAVVLVARVAEAGDEPGRVLHRPCRGVGDGGDGHQPRTAITSERGGQAPPWRGGRGDEGRREMGGGSGSSHGAQASEEAAANRTDRAATGLGLFLSGLWGSEKNGKYLEKGPKERTKRVGIVMVEWSESICGLD